MKKPIITFSVLIMILVYSMTVFAYIHSNFVGKDVFEMLCNRLERIENKIDLILGGK